MLLLVFGGPLKHWTARIALSDPELNCQELAGALADFKPDIARTVQGRYEVAITVTGETLRQATLVALALVADAGASDLAAVEVRPTDEVANGRKDMPVPDLVSVTEAATDLGVSPQAIRQRLDNGTVSGVKIGGTWAVLRAEVDRLRGTAGKSTGRS
jgi:hypothetical protein